MIPQPSTQAAHWASLVAEWQESGLTQALFCVQKNLVRHQFKYWRQRLGRSASKAKLPVAIPIFHTSLIPPRHDNLFVEIDRMEFKLMDGERTATVIIQGTIPFAVLQNIGQACAMTGKSAHV